MKICIDFKLVICIKLKPVFEYRYSKKTKYRKTPLLVPGVDPFSIANIYVLVQLKAETKTDLESRTCPLLSPILHYVIRSVNKKLLRFEKWPTPGTISGVFRYFLAFLILRGN